MAVKYGRWRKKWQFLKKVLFTSVNHIFFLTTICWSPSLMEVHEANFFGNFREYSAEVTPLCLSGPTQF
jgi:hypothetical protein